MRCIDRFCVIDGAIVMVGWDNPLHGDPKILLDDKEIEHQVCIRYERPDVVAAHGESYQQCGFRCVAVISEASAEPNFSVQFRDGVERCDTLPISNEAHATRQRFIDMVAQKENASLLELGSRARSGNTYKQLFPHNIQYTGTDISEGPNVDIIADAHILSKTISETFDFVFSVSVFEHLLMPWVVAFEINKILKSGGHAYIQSHPSWPIHEEPWDFFRFSKYSWAGLFNKFTGFEIIDVSHGIEAAVIPRFSNAPLQGIDLCPTYLLSACIVKKISDPMIDWSCDPSSFYDMEYSH